MNKNEKLLTIIYDLLVYLDKEDSKLYDFFKNLIFEPGNSFGFKPFSEISIYIMNGIENIYKSSSFDYLYYEDTKYQTIFEKNKKNGKKYFLKKIIEEKEFKENKEKELLTLLLNTLIFIKNKELEIGSKLSSLLVLEKDKNSNSFLSLYNITKILVNKITKIYPNKDLFNSFCFKYNFGKKNMNVTINNVNFKITNIEDFINLILNIYSKN